MKKFFKWLLIISVGLAVLLFVTFRVLRSQTKKHSPEDRVEFAQNGVELSVFYNRPYKKGREIFGKLIPYSEVWRTGANEPTTFSSNKDLKIGNNLLPAGEYTLWTIPNETSWTVIFNSKQYGWGVRVKDGKASREEEHDALTIDVPVKAVNEIVDQFTISFADEDQLQLVLSWDTVKIEVPIRY